MMKRIIMIEKERKRHKSGDGNYDNDEMKNFYFKYRCQILFVLKTFALPWIEIE